MRPRVLGAAVAAVALIVALPASSRPTLWERLRDPQAAREARLLTELERDLAARAEARFDASFDFEHGAVAAIDLAEVGTPRDPRLASAMGHVLVEADAGRDAEAVTLLERAVAALPTSELLADTWHELGLAKARGGDFAAARDAETHALENALEPDARASALYFRAMSEAGLGDLWRAASDYRAAVALALAPPLQAFTRFELGVTLERLGDVPAANAALENGLLVRLPLSTYSTDEPLDLPGLDFFPRYERFYLTALVAMSRARGEDDPHARRAGYEQAVEEWDAYLLAAGAEEPWTEHALRYRDQCTSELRKFPPRRHQGKAAPR
ncbi:MAG TPA: hypothetical protein VMI54_24525 [Polyangiaceae bacterium]|nr:hypothetical protein [Polyangiaceae bacterium]